MILKVIDKQKSLWEDIQFKKVNFSLKKYAVLDHNNLEVITCKLFSL